MDKLGINIYGNNKNLTIFYIGLKWLLLLRGLIAKSKNLNSLVKYYSCFISFFFSVTLFAQEPLYSHYKKFDVENGLPQNLVIGIVQDADGFIWISTLDGLVRYDGKEFLVFRHQPNDSTSLASNEIQALFRDSVNNLWVAYHNLAADKFNVVTYQPFNPRAFMAVQTMSQSVPLNYATRVALYQDAGRIRNRTKLFRLFFYESDKLTVAELSDPSNEKVELLMQTLTRSITKDVQGRLFFEHGQTIFRLEHDGQISMVWKYPGKQGLRTLFVDRTNTLWVGTDSDGLYQINLFTPSFASHSYQDDFLTDVLVNEVGINRKIGKDEIKTSEVYYTSYAYTDNDSLYININQEGINYTGRNSTIALVKDQSLVTVYTSERHGLIASGPEKKILFFDNKGLLYQWSNFSQPPSVTKTELPLINGYSNVIDFAADRCCYWVTTPNDGTRQLKANKILTTIKPYGSYTSNVILSDPRQDHILWIGTLSGGLYKWDKVQRKLIATYTTENGLPNNTINSIVPDSLGYFWMSTNKGITRFNPLTETFTNYSMADGLLESEFNRHHDLLLPDGRIAMGGTNGYSIFHPKEFSEDTYTPQIFITKVTVNGKSVDHLRDSTLLPLPINQLDEINLTYTNNSIGFEVAATQFNAPEKIKYRYQLEGFDRNWVQTEGDGKIRFNQLPYGSYTLLLNASNTIGVWSPNVRKLDIVVHPPFWLTWWAYSFYALLVGLVVRAFWRGYKKRLHAKQEAAFNIREAARLRELDETKSRFFSNITHEFRTPLTLILSPLEKHLKDMSLSPKALTLLNNNYRHASQLLKLVNQLLDINKLEAGQMLVNPTAGELTVFAEQCINAFQTQAREKNLALTSSFENFNGYYLFDHEKWEKVIFNLLSNAIKFTSSGGGVHFSVAETTEKLEDKSLIRIQVKDSGIGIHEDQLPKVFERFYQVDDSSTRKHEGTGIGLALVKELVDLMRGKINVSSVPGKGTLFTVELPIEKLRGVPSAQEVTSINDFQMTVEETVSGVDHDIPVILVVEDNDELRSFIKESLATNWKILDASNGLDGWTVIERELPEIVITDVMMPGMNGFELCSKSKKDPRTCHINFIMLTAKAAQESKIEGLELGADEYLTKPFHLYELELRIRNLLQEQHSLRKRLQDKLLPKKPAVKLPHVNDIFLSKLQAYFDNNLENTKLKVETVAEAMAMSKSTLNRKLKTLLNISLNEYIKQYRLQKAVAFLSAGHSISEVSYRVGFETASYFSQCFKEHYQQTPSEFIRTNN